MEFIIVGDLGAAKSCEIVGEKEVADRVIQLKNQGTYPFNNLKVYRIAEEINITVAYPDYIGGDDTGGCR